jgi:hypothetical protein
LSKPYSAVGVDSLRIMVTKLFTVGNLVTMATMLFNVGQKQPKGMAGIRYK